MRILMVPYVAPVEVLVLIAAAAVDPAEPPKTTPGAESLRPDGPDAASRSTSPTGVNDRLNASAVGVADLNSSFGVSWTPLKFRGIPSPEGKCGGGGGVEPITSCELSLGCGLCNSSAVEAAATA